MVYEYLKEIIVRIFYCSYTFIFSFFIIFNYREEYLYWFSSNVWDLIDNGTFIFTGISEVFFSYFYLSLIISSYISGWLIFLNIYLFLLPGFLKKEAKVIFNYLLISFLVFGLIFRFLHYYGIIFFCNYLLDYKITQGIGGFVLNFEPRFGEFLIFLYKLDFIILVLLICIFFSLFFFNLVSKKALVVALHRVRKWIYFGVIGLILLIFPADVFLHLIVFSLFVMIFEFGCFLICIKKQF